MEPVVVKISGSLIYPPRLEYMRGLREAVSRAADEGARLAIVVGGGPLARSYIEVLRGVGVNQSIQDLAGIIASRANAYFTASLLYPRSPLTVPGSVEEVLEAYASGRIPVIGGFEPGQSTNAVSLLVAEAIGAGRVVDLLNGVKGVYDRDPSTPGARLLERLTLSQLEAIVSRYEQEAGKYALMDHVAVSIARRSRIKVHFIDGSDPYNLLRVLRGERMGSVVEPD